MDVNTDFMKSPQLHESTHTVASSWLFQSLIVFMKKRTTMHCTVFDCSKFYESSGVFGFTIFATALSVAVEIYISLILSYNLKIHCTIVTTEV